MVSPWTPWAPGVRRARPVIPARLETGREGGFTFIGLMFAVAILGIALAGVGVLWQMEGRREKEKELLFIGEQYRKAIGSYHEKSPGAAKQFPEKLEDLLQDNRFPKPIRHLRRLYADPMTADGKWELIRQEGRIIGVASFSREKPIKVAGFPKDLEDFESAATYSDWRFMGSASGAQIDAGAATQPGPAQPAMER